MTQTLDQIRAEIVARLDRERDAVGACDAASLDAHRRLDLASAELAAHDRAVALFAPPPTPEPAKRRDIAALVREALTDDWQTIAQIAEKTGLPPSRLLRVLDRRRANAERDAGGGQWRTRVRAGGLST